MYMPRNHRFTIYDAMEAKGVFAANPANVDSRDAEGLSAFKGPVEYPKMLYHPRGEERIVTPARREPSPIGPMEIPAVRELINCQVNSREEEEEKKGEGWHDHPAFAIEARTGIRPAMGSAQRVRDLEAELASQKTELERYKKLVAEDASRRQTESQTQGDNKPVKAVSELGAKLS